MKTTPIILVLAIITSVVFGHAADRNYDEDPVAEAAVVEDWKHQEDLKTPCPKGAECKWINEKRCGK
jgi:hypothetical protein